MNKKHNSGFTLVEFTVAMALILMITVPIYTLFASNTRDSKAINDQITVQDNIINIMTAFREHTPYVSKISAINSYDNVDCMNVTGTVKMRSIKLQKPTGTVEFVIDDKDDLSMISDDKTISIAKNVEMKLTPYAEDGSSTTFKKAVGVGLVVKSSLTNSTYNQTNEVDVENILYFRNADDIVIGGVSTLAPIAAATASPAAPTSTPKSTPLPTQPTPSPTLSPTSAPANPTNAPTPAPTTTPISKKADVTFKFEKITGEWGNVYCRVSAYDSNSNLLSSVDYFGLGMNLYEYLGSWNPSVNIPVSGSSPFVINFEGDLQGYSIGEIVIYAYNGNEGANVTINNNLKNTSGSIKITNGSNKIAIKVVDKNGTKTVTQGETYSSPAR